jgi:MoaA/NifB/PqqE/SkfB family radical SAM enzyme
MIKNWDKFQARRRIPEEHKMIGCYAAFNHMRISKDASVHPCCFNNKRHNWLHDGSLKEYWFNGLNVEYQDAFLNQELHEGCQICLQRIEADSHPAIVEYDYNMGDDRLEYAMNSGNYPKIIEFEISDLCNLECEMCHAGLSSKLRMGRDKHLVSKHPYYRQTNEFDKEENMNELIEQLKEFIPHLEEIRFVGGEPFAHKGMFKLAKVISEINPSVVLRVCTNGTIFNKQVKSICENNNLKVTISCDTVIEEEYKQIRIGANYKNTYDNIQKFKEAIGTENVTINATFMSVNAENMDKFFEYAIENGFNTFINVYVREWREHTKDWRIETMSDEAKRSALNKMKELLNKTNKSNHVAEINKVIGLLS